MHRSAVRHLIDENRGFVVMGSRRSNTLLLFSALVFASLASARSKPPDANAVRWAEGAPGSTFSRGADGKYSYGLHSKDLSVTLTVDAQELQLTRRRLTHFLGVFLDVRYEGSGTLVFDPNTATLEYSSHYRVTKASLDPEGFAERIESGGEEVSDETGRHVEKHPEKKEQSEALARAYQKDVAELLEFVNTQSLKSTTLSTTAPRASGWVLFGTNNRWIGKWKKREDLIFRITLTDRVLEFPFSLPPKSSDVTLKERD